VNAVGIVICTWNRGESLRATLLSLQEQAVPPGVAVEVVVVDNNSNDDTRAVVEALGAGWRLGQLRYVFEARQGKQFALNAGIAASSASLLAFTDDDILFPPGWIEAVCATFADPLVELAGGRTLLAWPEGGAPRWYDDEMQAILGAVELGPRRLLPPPPGYAPAGANLVARRSVFERVGAFSERHFRHMDYEFGMRCTRLGIGVAYAPELVVQAPVDPAMLSKRYFRRWSFKAGILGRDEDAPGLPTLLGVPRWVFSRLAADLLRYPLDVLLRPARRGFARELRIWRATGTIASRWYEWVWPEKYPQWVEYYSQKKKNLY
jgi:glycosyltransferase involved in cell wall biosynthesis